MNSSFITSRPDNMERKIVISFSYPSIKEMCLVSRAVLLGTHNICFG